MMSPPGKMPCSIPLTVSMQPSARSAQSRVKRARKTQANRFQKMKIHTNAHMNSRQIRQFCAVDSESEDLLEKAMEKLGLSARAHSRILKISRTIADLEDKADIGPHHVDEAIQYRTLDRRIFI